MPAFAVGSVIARRLGVFAGSLLAASMLVFLACAWLPGDAAQVILGTNADPAALATLRRQLGTDRPLLVRYVEWIGGVAKGDFGRSQLTGQPVSNLIAPRLEVTVSLVINAMVAALLISVPLGTWAAVRRRHLDGFFVSAATQIGLAVPAFWAGILGIYVFAVYLRWLPAGGFVSLTANPVGWAQHLVLPVASLAVVQGAVLARYVRSATIEVLTEDYFRTARAIGWTQWGALLRHGLRNAALSVVTVIGLQLATMLVGAIVVETVFTLPGLGSLLLSAVASRDLVIVQGTVLLLVVAVLAINAAVDLSYRLIDPRLRRT